MAYADGYLGPEGIGGWLAFFMFGFSFVSPLRALFGSWSNLYGDEALARILGERWLAYQIAEWAIIGLSLAVIGYITWRLVYVRDRKTVRLTVFAIPFLAIGTTLLDILATTVIGGFDAGALFSALSIDIVRGAIYSVLWCSYFLVSKRVQTTYAGEPVDQAYQIFE